MLLRRLRQLLSRKTTVLYPFVGDSIGGSHLSALLLLRHLDRRRFRFRIVLHEHGPLEAHLQSLGLTFDVLPLPAYVNKPFDDPRHPELIQTLDPILERYLRRRRVDLVHTNDLRMHATWVTAASEHTCGHIWHQRTAGFGGNSFKRELAGRAAGIVCISQFVRQRMPEDLHHLCRVVPNPFETDPISRQSARTALIDELNLPGDAVTIGFVGNLTKQKRPDVFVDMAARLVPWLDYPVVFLLAGSDRDWTGSDLLQRAQAAGIDDDVKLLGFRTGVTRLMAGLDVLVAPAVEEGLGRTVIEAMLVGTPVVAADSGGHSEVICAERTGVLVPPDDATALAEAVRRLLANPDDAAKMADRARHEAARQYSVEGHVNTMTDVYREIVDGAASARG